MVVRHHVEFVILSTSIRQLCTEEVVFFRGFDLSKNLTNIFKSVSSVQGLHFDYLAFNTLGHTCYMIYNLGLFAIPSIVDEFERRHPLSLNPVEFNDLFFPIHGVALCLVGILQCFIYEVNHSKTLYLTRFVGFLKYFTFREDLKMCLGHAGL